MKKIMKLLLAAVVASFLIIPVAFAADAEVDFVVKGSSTVVVPDAELTVYLLNTTTEEYEQYGSTYVSNSAGRVNNILVPENGQFYAVAVDASDNIYANANAAFANIWMVLSDGSIQNIDTGSTRSASTSYVHLYPGYWTADGEAPLETATPDPAPTPAPEPESTQSAEQVELEVTVYDKFRNPIAGADVSIYLRSDSVYDGPITTGSSGRTDGLFIPLGQEIYAQATDGTTSYGGVYDYYYDRPNYWQTDDGEILENTGTSLTRILYLHLYPIELLPSEFEDSSETFDPDTYLCGSFPDALYNSVTHEECEAINYVQTEGIFSGTGEGLIELYRPINRAEVTKVMVEAFNVELLGDTSGVSQFPDVPQGQWFTNYVYSARSKAIVDGYPDGFFRPVNTINRVELLRIFVESSGVDYSSVPTDYTFFHDITVEPGTAWFMGYANYTFINELLQHDGNLKPSQPMTRLDVIKLLYRASL